MTTTFNEFNYSFIIEVLNPEHAHLFYYRIDQRCRNLSSDAEVDRSHGAVNRYLHWVAQKTGLRYCVLLSGPVSEVNTFVKLHSLEIS